MVSSSPRTQEGMIGLGDALALRATHRADLSLLYLLLSYFYFLFNYFVFLIFFPFPLRLPLHSLIEGTIQVRFC